MTDQIYRIRIKRGDVEIEVEGDKEFVEKTINDWKNSLEQTHQASTTSPKEEASTKEISTKETGFGTLKQFYDGKLPSGHHENVAVFAYYLKGTEGKDEFSKDDINSCYTKAMARKPKNINASISDAANKYQLVEKGSSKGFWRLTTHGENLVVHDLPRKKE